MLVRSMLELVLRLPRVRRTTAIQLFSAASLCPVVLMYLIYLWIQLVGPLLHS